MTSPSSRDLIARDSLRSSRDRALNAVAEVYTTDRAQLDLALYDALEDAKAKEAEIARLKTVVSELRNKLAQFEPDTPAL
jgi:hypothetical protein